MVRFILVLMTLPVKILPRMETLPVKGLFNENARPVNFLTRLQRVFSSYAPLLVDVGAVDGLVRCLLNIETCSAPCSSVPLLQFAHLEAEADILVPSLVTGSTLGTLSGVEDGLLVEALDTGVHDVFGGFTQKGSPRTPPSKSFGPGGQILLPVLSARVAPLPRRLF